MEQEKRRKFNFSFFWIFLPSLLIAVFFFYSLEDYNLNKEEGEQLQAEAEEIIDYENRVEHFLMLQDGQTIVISSLQEGLLLTEMDSQSNELLNSYHLDSDNVSQLVVSYQNDGIVLATKGYKKEMEKDNQQLGHVDELHFYYYEFGNEPVKLEMPTIIMDTYLESRTLEFEHAIYVIGNNPAGDFVTAIVENAKVETINLSQMATFKSLEDVGFKNVISSDFYYPILELDLYDNTSYTMSLVKDENSQFPVYDLDSSSELERKVLAPYLNVTEPIIIIRENQAVQFDISSFSVMNTIETPEEIFYPRIFHLSKDHIALIGKDSINNNAQHLVYIYDYAGEQLQFDLSGYMREYPYLVQDYNSLDFHIQMDDDILYFSSMLQAGSINLSKQITMTSGINEYRDGLAAKANEKLAQSEQLLHEGEKVSLQRLFSFAINEVAGQGLGLLFFAFFLTPIIIFSIGLFSELRRLNQLDIAYKNGGEQCRGIIIDVRQTGTYINEQPQVQMSVEFTFRQGKLTRQLKKIVSLIDPPRKGDAIDIVYDPRKDKVYLVDESQKEAL